MSILIKGMEMPTSCYYCSFSVEKYEGSGVYDCVVTDNCVCKGAERNVDCPIVPVPDHGDLIDRREAIIDANERAYDFWLSDDEVDATIQFLKEQPTIIPADLPVMEYPQVPGITPTVISDKEGEG